LKPVNPQISNDEIKYHNVKLTIDRQARVATLTVSSPQGNQSVTAATMREAGSDFWPLQTFREIDHAILHLRFNEPEIGVLVIKTEGDLNAVRKMDEMLARESK